MSVDWVTVSSLATAGGTLVLAVATFASVRSANRAARVAEQSLLAGIRPMLIPSHPEDPPIKAGFADDHFVHIPGGGGTAEVTPDAIYLTLSIRNAGQGIAVLHGWRFERSTGVERSQRPPFDDFRRLTRDLYIPVGDYGFWQGAIRDQTDPQWDVIAERIKNRERFIVDLMYGDLEGGQRIISRFSYLPTSKDDSWHATVSRHWNVDRPDPR